MAIRAGGMPPGGLPDGDPQGDTRGEARGEAARRCLVVELGPAMLARMPDPGAALVLARFATIDATLMARVMPDLVLAPLFGSGFDILDLAQRLVMLGYRGPLRALTAALPDPDAVAREVRGHCKGIDFGLIVIAVPG